MIPMPNFNIWNNYVFLDEGTLPYSHVHKQKYTPTTCWHFIANSTDTTPPVSLTYTTQVLMILPRFLSCKKKI